MEKNFGKNFQKFWEKILKKKFWKSCHGGHFPKIYFSKFGRKIKFFLDGKYLILIRNIDITRESLVKMSVRGFYQKLKKSHFSTHTFFSKSFFGHAWRKINIFLISFKISKWHQKLRNVYFLFVYNYFFRRVWRLNFGFFSKKIPKNPKKFLFFKKNIIFFFYLSYKKYCYLIF